ncbi:hypothetical protein BCR37DRAFT_394504 [Protomyces lactucae-debilis]|uniref:Uncharacterized protein n=1 Tax=Protomyces lactucae-debilis TaxID=2754530 RepID=A0A1Y2F6J8_PROLT|nr:uncharacterized protein BCR37DRAFT_394504 [Protomyces lactucae-debilis]ORY78555.1 hypothetical protein BCR37DRAFT_394504 [Protomyces lactucae-debilis]
MSATPPPKNSLLATFLRLPPRQRIIISASLMGVSCAGLYVTDKVERTILERQKAENTVDKLGIDVVTHGQSGSDYRNLETRGSSTDAVRIMDAKRKAEQ